jgi:hypothetical protein
MTDDPRFKGQSAGRVGAPTHEAVELERLRRENAQLRHAVKTLEGALAAMESNRGGGLGRLIRR